MNNYNYKKNGISIDLNISYDNEVSQINYDENFESFGEYLLYTSYGNIKARNYYSDYFIINEKKTLKKDLIELYLYYNNIDENEKLSKDYLFEYLYGEVGERSTLEEIEGLLNEYNIVYTKEFEIIESHGYAQGDYQEVIIPVKDLKKAWGCKEIDMRSLKDNINQLLWDCPVYINMEIEKENETYTLNACDFDIDEYENDEEKIEEKIREYFKDDQDVLNELDSFDFLIQF